MTMSNIFILVVRYGLVVLFFPASALDKIFNFKGAVKQAGEVFSSLTVAIALILASLFVAGHADWHPDRCGRPARRLHCGRLLRRDRPIFKRFWKPGDFWKKGDSKARELFWDILKNFSLASGFLLIILAIDGHA